MSWRIVKSRVASADLLAIWLHIAPDNIEAADRQLDRIERAVSRLADYPHSGPARHDLGPEIRALLVTRHLVLYRVRANPKQVELLRIIDGRRDLASVFSSGEP
jgi:toxin ParE1/3/4